MSSSASRMWLCERAPRWRQTRRRRQWPWRSSHRPPSLSSFSTSGHETNRHCLHGQQSLLRDMQQPGSKWIRYYNHRNTNRNHPKRHGIITLGMVRETYDPWERRAPLTPNNVQELLDTIPQLRIVVQPASQRIFADADYAQAGAVVLDDLSTADIVLGVKRPHDLSTSSLMPDKTYIFFSHTVKGQIANMGLLQTCLDRRIQLLDYERMMTPPSLTNNATKSTTCTPSSQPAAAAAAAAAATTTASRRLVTFGRYAGLAGTLDALSVLGRRLLYQFGANTPLLTLPPTIQHESLLAAMERLEQVGQTWYDAHHQQHSYLNHETKKAHSTTSHNNNNISNPFQLPEPIVIAVTGQGGTVHAGAIEILQCLDPALEMIDVKDLPHIVQDPTTPRDKFYIVPVDLHHVMSLSSSSSLSASSSLTSSTVLFDRTHFKQYPTQYVSHFADRVAAWSHVIINTVYWDVRYPRFLTKTDLRRLWQHNQDRLMLISDISCDIHGSMECLDRTTSIEQPYFLYDPVLGRPCDITDMSAVRNDSVRRSIAVLGVDILPSELPTESSRHFGKAVTGVVKELLQAVNFCNKEQDDHGVGQKVIIEMDQLSPGIAGACITTPYGMLSSSHAYLQTLLDRAMTQDETISHTKDDASISIALEGHLFDSGLINQIMDVIEYNGCGLKFEQCIFPPHASNVRMKSSVVLQIFGSDMEKLHKIEGSIQTLVQVVERAEAAVVVLERITRDGTSDSSSDRSPRRGGRIQVEGPNTEKKVLLLGAGRVSKSVVDLIGRVNKNIVVCVVSDHDDEARNAASASKKAQHVALDIEHDPAGLSDLIKASDLVVSLLPSPLHPVIAEQCIQHGRNLVTASYESDEMRALADRAFQAGIIILNEVGLDPGLDHMSAMQMIDDIRSRGGTVTSFVSVCGGLPSHVRGDNPLQYKFSWSPRGVLRASQANARYRWKGKTVEVHGPELLQAAVPFVDVWEDLDLECLPNRDSIRYEDVYNIRPATIFRGTLRYQGFSELMAVFQCMGLLDESIQMNRNRRHCWQDIFDHLRNRRGGFDSVEDFVRGCANDDARIFEKAMNTLRWLNMIAETEVDGKKYISKTRSLVVDYFCDALERKMAYGPGEHDMVLMHHSIGAVFPDPEQHRWQETHHSRLRVVCEGHMSAMSKTVGYTTAASALLLLDGTLDDAPRGLLLPTSSHVYEPVLNALEREGIVFHHDVTVE